MTDALVLDLDHLRRYTGGDSQLEAEIFTLFREQCAMWGRVLDPTGDAEAWRSATHALKGSARGVGAFALAEACARAEGLAGEDGTPVARSVALADVRGAIDAALGEVSRLERKASASFRGQARSG